ncbi:enoyl-CoA hydratase-related protein [Nocardia jinanensis]|uniref:Enoyl-CoA hydratase n=1 Tax=Nocardia jinanensis TaxID=382504 RepID=A0A917RMV4_9NOCA|nr:enoyl-CoA hydratase-related protein [Nocardia jinanensis]GGL15517.1 enoyl-CoA hydratase [Nocardia jinanensis]
MTQAELISRDLASRDETATTETAERPVRTELHGAVLVITIDRPRVRNAVDAAVAEGIGDALEYAQADPAVRAIVLTGAVGPCFCSGGDLGEMAAGRSIEPADPAKQGWGFGGICEHPIDKPIVAAVNGHAIGGGAEMALACDLVVAVESAEFSLPEVRRGYIASGGGAVWLSRWVPRAIAMEILLLGDRFSAAQAERWGLVNRVVPDGQALTAALALAEAIAANAPLAVQAHKRLVAGLTDSRFAAAASDWARNHAEHEHIHRTEDAAEGPRAFIEKRAPVWKGR